MQLTQVTWLPSPPDGTQITLGMDGSENDDWTAIRAETIDGHQFTPRYGPDKRPAVWNPAEWGGEIPRGEVDACVDELMTRFKVKRMYCDPHGWYTEIGNWSVTYGDDVVFEWNCSRISRMFEEIVRFQTDLREKRITHDGCPYAAMAFANARKIAKPGQKYILGKPTQHQKIDVAMSSILAHTAAADAHTAGWGEETDNRMWCFG
ncbi:terminase [Glutamicibacter soli]|uniref:terminase n=1 Tax=Glutamicibacter soli TaxID=453836 RepID=UPI003FD00429